MVRRIHDRRRTRFEQPDGSDPTVPKTRFRREVAAASIPEDAASPSAETCQGAAQPGKTDQRANAGHGADVAVQRSKAGKSAKLEQASDVTSISDSETEQRAKKEPQVVIVVTSMAEPAR